MLPADLLEKHYWKTFHWLSMPCRHILACSLSAFAIFGVSTEILLAQAPDLVTDRPDQTESSAVVPLGFAQIETGYLYTRDSGSSSREFPGTLIRIGIARRVELRFGHAGFISSDSSSGAGDSQIGAKVNLVGESGWRPEVAVLTGFSLPTGQASLSSGRVDPSVLVAFSHTLSSRVSLGYNIGNSWESLKKISARQRLLQYSLVFGVEITDKFGGFIEAFGNRAFNSSRTPANSIDAGVTYLLADNVQLDLYAGRGLSAGARDTFVGGGISFRLPN